MFECFTDRARHVMERANKLAVSRCHDFVDTPHLLAAILEEDGIGSRALKQSADEEALRLRIAKRIKQNMDKFTIDPLPLCHAAFMAVLMAADESHTLKHKQIGTEHLLLGLLYQQPSDEKRGVSVNKVLEILEEVGVSANGLRDTVLALLKDPARMVPEPTRTALAEAFDKCHDQLADLALTDLDLQVKVFVTHVRPIVAQARALCRDGLKMTDELKSALDELTSSLQQLRATLDRKPQSPEGGNS